MIFAVAVGMVTGADNLVLAAIGFLVVSAAALMVPAQAPPVDIPYPLDVRLALGHDPAVAVQPTLDTMGVKADLVGASTSREGTTLEVTYRVRVGQGTSPAALATTLHRVPGVQGASLQLEGQSE